MGWFRLVSPLGDILGVPEILIMVKKKIAYMHNVESTQDTLTSILISDQLSSACLRIFNLLNLFHSALAGEHNSLRFTSSQE